MVPNIAGIPGVFDVTAAVWLGILTSISPCPLATNIAAVSYLGKNLKNPSDAVWSGLSYTVGRSIAYIIFAFLVMKGIFSIPGLSMFMQTYFNKILGFLLIATGMILLEMFSFSLPGVYASESFQKKIAGKGILGAGILGFVFALAMCPVSAALFFGTLIPLAVKTDSVFLIPLSFGSGTGIPVFISGIVLAKGLWSAGKFFERITAIDLWARRITGTIFIIAGLWMIVMYIWLV